jgi:hypothetical protein
MRTAYTVCNFGSPLGNQPKATQKTAKLPKCGDSQQSAWQNWHCRHTIVSSVGTMARLRLTASGTSFFLHTNNIVYLNISQKILYQWQAGENLQKFTSLQTYLVGRYSAVSIATRYGLEGLGIESRLGRDFPHLSRQALGPTQLPIRWVPCLSRGLNFRGVALTTHHN